MKKAIVMASGLGAIKKLADDKKLPIQQVKKMAEEKELPVQKIAAQTEDNVEDITDQIKKNKNIHQPQPKDKNGPQPLHHTLHKNAHTL